MSEKYAYIKIAAEHAKLKRISDAFTVEDTVDEIFVVFDFRTEDWSGLTKTAVFIKENNTSSTPVHVILDTTNTCAIPASILADDGDFSVGVFGVDSTHRLPTDLLRFKIHKGCYSEGVAPSTPAQDVYQQIITMMTTHINNSTAHISAAERSTWNAKANTSDIPTKVSDLTNDAGYLTQHQDISGPINTHNTSSSAHANLFAGKADRIDGTIISDNADYAEILQWYDNNSNAEDRIGLFVMLDADTPGRTIKVASQNSDVVGVTVENPAFSGNAANKFDANGDLLPQYEFVAVHGIVPIIDNGLCTVKGRCMPSADGTAIPSTNGLGYFCMERVDATHILIVVEPNADMLKRVKDDVVALQNSKANASDIPTKTSDLTNDSGFLTGHQTLKTVNNQSIVGTGNIEINSGVWGNITGNIENQNDLQEVLDDKADKVTSAINGDFASLDANGNLTDSGYNASDFATAAQGTKADNAVLYTSQSLSTTQRAQVRTNIGAGTISAINGVPSEPADINADTLDNHSASYFATASSLSSYRTSAAQDVIDATKQAIPTQITTGTNITLADNTEYRLSDVTTLTLAYPQGSFECWLKIATASDGTISITLPTSSYIGSTPTFGNGETWEISIKDGVVVAGKAVSA